MKIINFRKILLLGVILLFTNLIACGVSNTENKTITRTEEVKKTYISSIDGLPLFDKPFPIYIKENGRKYGRDIGIFEYEIIEETPITEEIVYKETIEMIMLEKDDSQFPKTIKSKENDSVDMNLIRTYYNPKTEIGKKVSYEKTVFLGKNSDSIEPNIDIVFFDKNSSKDVETTLPLVKVEVTPDVSDGSDNYQAVYSEIISLPNIERVKGTGIYESYPVKIIQTEYTALISVTYEEVVENFEYSEKVFIAFGILGVLSISIFLFPLLKRKKHE